LSPIHKPSWAYAALSRNVWIGVLIVTGVVGAVAGASVSDSVLWGSGGGFLVGVAIAVFAILFDGFLP
jgi:hypothetical protein